jgi:hypothetical protein
MRGALKMLTFLALVPWTTWLVAQTGQHEAKSTSVASDRSAQEKDFSIQQDTFRKQATAAFDREMARDKADDCPDAHTTYDEIACLGKALEITNSNYKAYLGALRSLLGLTTPGREAASGPTGKPLTPEEAVQEFDEVEALWQKYRSAQTSAIFNHWKGGTIAPVMAGSCELQLLRNHMRELDGIYDMMLRH